MNITKNNEIFITSINGRLENDTLRVAFSYNSPNTDNYKIAQLIERHFELIDDDFEYKNDVYKIDVGSIDPDGEGGGGYEYKLEDIEYLKTEVVDEKIVVIYKVKLSNRETFSY